MIYTVRVTTTEIQRYHIEANTPAEAKELVMTDDYDPYETVDASIDDIEVDLL